MTAFLAKYHTWLLGALAALLLAGFLANRLESRRTADLKAAAQRLHVAQDSLHAALAATAARERVIVQLTARADSANVRAAGAARAASALQAQIPALLARVEAAHGDTLTDAERALYGAEEARADSLEAALVARTREVGLLRQSLDSAETSVHVLVPAAVAVDTAATSVVAKMRPSLFARIAPKPGYGLAAGIDQNGHPALVLGVTLSWPR